jgi:hypothetical protein
MIYFSKLWFNFLCLPHTGKQSPTVIGATSGSSVVIGAQAIKGFERGIIA